jgi:hypothetical protein
MSNLYTCDMLSRTNLNYRRVYLFEPIGDNVLSRYDLWFRHEIFLPVDNARMFR